MIKQQRAFRPVRQRNSPLRETISLPGRYGLILTKALEGVRSVGAVKRGWSRLPVAATGAQPSRILEKQTRI